MKKSIKYIGFAVLGVVVLFFFATQFSEAESSFQCFGEISFNGTTRPMTVYMKLTEYRPWVLSDSHGSINLEIPNEWIEYYGHIEEVGDQLQIYETYPQKMLKGNFSRLSKTLAIDLESPFGFFDGNCITN
ncbi:MAG: hypothetical protein A3C58_03330 [Candidatus Staskawiczbacteria bacterium RIFCSPHIGHO2_02_FULL_34_10]|uniref:Uncharacterized protein n=2 Tax=Candidatus Staskawicziibacteriota TaxID=1817916 RepID=A0A1G2HJN7_9BACT|nr:MAG: hypothetical protein A2639_00655 [Candidatus Staskawiczbacteria bacterium RIFCSPHIGHO2_01_FULL_34_27]OGZ67424.1 MAG: hypothetical protein A3C58_03330 [Candidatus Staskawiczbacteria bacterium RIFCSPHIGHO2_02_FULL_34_10]